MKARQLFHKFLYACGRVLPGFACLLVARESEANPTGMTVAAGSATAQSSGSQLNITASQNAVLNWSSFNIAAGERTVFNQPSSTSVVFNRIYDQNPSLIYGSLQANGVVVLLNSSGFYFGPNSFVSAAGLVVSTANCAPPQNSGGAWQFNGPPPLASIVNYGQIKIGNGGDCFFIGDKVENHGDIEAPGGSIAFAAGQTVTLSERPDGRGMSMQVTLPQGSVDNYGNVIADGGTIALNAKVVNQNGLIQADSVQNNNGVIELVASDALNLGADSKISASGDASAGGSAGGSITLKSDNTFSDVSGSEIAITGGANGGDGGAVEISAPVMPALNTKINGQAQAGSKGGSLLLDPDFIVLDESGTDTPTVNGSIGTVQSGDSPGGTLHFNVNSQFTGLSDITLQAVYDITFADGTAWDLSGSTGQSSGQLTLEAGRNIIFGNTTSLADENSWSVSLYAGVTDFTHQTVAPGAGSIYLNAFDPSNPGNVASDPSGSIMTAAGSITLVAGQDITVGTGRVVTSAGGSISAHALAGNIDAGGYAQGYDFSPGHSAATGYSIDPSLGVGGISTMAGGDVDLTAGGNVTSVSAANNGYVYDGNFVATGANAVAATAGAGAYGIGLPGNVNIVAGGNVTGNYIVADGAGTVVAGAKMDANGNPVKSGANYVLGSAGNAGLDPDDPNYIGQAFALNLITGGWNVSAAQNIYLQEVRNPNGDFNTVSSRSGAFHAFDYGAADYVDLTAGNFVKLGGVSPPPRLSSLDSLNVPVIYPGILNIVAGAGGVEMEGNTTFNQLILFPTPLGGLTIDTTDGGSLTGVLPAITGTPQIFSLIISDSGQIQYNSATRGLFGLNDHAATPVHLGSEMPVTLDIAGDMDYLMLASPEAATVTVHGDINNSRFQGMNLSASDTTSIDVTGNINNRGDFTTVDLSTMAGTAAPDLSELAYAITDPGQPGAGQLLSSFFYDPTTHKLTYEAIPNANLGNILTLLQNLTVQVVKNGVPQWQDPPFDTIPLKTTVSIFNSATAQALLSAYNAAGVAPSGAFGYTIGGGGQFDISANNMDLGTTAGIKSLGAGLYNVAGAYPLAKLFNTGPDIVVNLSGTLSMFSTAIASLNGGNIYVNADGDLDVGSPDFTVNSLGARGIFATGRGNVAVYAGGDINIVGSRVAVYDTRPPLPGIPAPGGSLTVVSRNGNVNVGSGGSGFAVVNSFYVDPVTQAVTTQNPTIPGTGILETSFNVNGNVLVEALNGDVQIGVGGVKQVLFKGNQTAVDKDELAKLFRLALEGNYAAARAYEDQINGVIAGAVPSFVDVYAGYGLERLDASKNPVLDQFGNPEISAVNLADGTLQNLTVGKNITAEGAGIVSAGNLDVKATGGVNGTFASTGGNVDITAIQSITANVFAAGTASVSSEGGSISGLVIGIAGVSASGSDNTVDLESNGTISGPTSGSSGFTASATAGNVSAAAANENTAPAAKSTEDNTDEDLKKKKPIALAQKVSRVTVILPKKN